MGWIAPMESIQFISCFWDSLALGPTQKRTGCNVPLSVISKFYFMLHILNRTSLSVPHAPNCVSMLAVSFWYVECSFGKARSSRQSLFKNLSHFFAVFWRSTCSARHSGGLIGKHKLWDQNLICCVTSVSGPPLSPCTAHPLLYVWCMLGQLTQKWLSWTSAD